jgi:hypothetical protein
VVRDVATFVGVDGCVSEYLEACPALELRRYVTACSSGSVLSSWLSTSETQKTYRSRRSPTLRRSPATVQADFYDPAGGRRGPSRRGTWACAARLQLLDKGQVEHAFIGIQPAQPTREVARDFDLGESTSVLVYGVTQDGPAVRAGIEPGDVLTRRGGRQLESVEDLYATLRQHRPGQELRAQFVRGGTASRRHTRPFEQAPVTEAPLSAHPGSEISAILHSELLHRPV